MTDALSKLTGLATKDQLYSLTDFLQKIEQGLVTASDAWKTGTQHFMAAFRADKTRVDNIFRVLHLQRQSIFQLQSQLTRLYHRTSTRVEFFTKIIESLSMMILQTSEIDSIYEAMQLLNTHNLAHFFVSHQALNRALAYFERYLQSNHPELTLLRRDIQYYYRQASFSVFRSRNTLVIILDAPLTAKVLLPPLHVYQVQKVPLLSPDRHSHYTLLASDIAAIAYNPDSDYYLAVVSLHDLNFNILHLHDTNLVVYKRGTWTCAIALINGVLAHIKKHCGYYVIDAPLPRQIFKLSEDTVLFSNISTVTVFCPELNQTETIVSTEVQFVYTLQCNCILSAGEIQFFTMSTVCVAIENISTIFAPKHILNIPYLSEFVRDDIINLFKPDTLLNDSLSVDLPALAIASKEYEANLAVEEHSKFELISIINRTKDDEEVFSELSHYLYKVLLKSHTHTREWSPLNLYDWLLAIAAAGALLALGLIFIFHYRLKSVLLMLATLRKANALELPTKITYFRTTAAPMLMNSTNKDYSYYLDILQELVPVDFSILICLLLLIVTIVIYLAYKRMKVTDYRTFIKLEILNEASSVLCHVAKLKYNPEMYCITVNKQFLSVVKSMCRTIVLWPAGV